MLTVRTLLSIALGTVLASAGAAEVPAPPPLPPDTTPAPAQEPEEIAPEVTITTKDGEMREEYRLHGRLYMIKVTPRKGKPYYLIDYEGSGEFRRSDLEPRTSPPMWVIKRW
jgi:hypothetical protein